MATPQQVPAGFVPDGFVPDAAPSASKTLSVVKSVPLPIAEGRANAAAPAEAAPKASGDPNIAATNAALAARDLPGIDTEPGFVGDPANAPFEAGIGQAGRGVSEIARSGVSMGPGLPLVITDPKLAARGASDVIRGGLGATAPIGLPVAVGAAASAGPAAVAATGAYLLLASGASNMATFAAKKAGLAPEYADLAGDIAGLLVLGKGGKDVLDRIAQSKLAGRGVNVAERIAADIYARVTKGRVTVLPPEEGAAPGSSRPTPPEPPPAEPLSLAPATPPPTPPEPPPAASGPAGTPIRPVGPIRPSGGVPEPAPVALPLEPPPVSPSGREASPPSGGILPAGQDAAPGLPGRSQGPQLPPSGPTPPSGPGTPPRGAGAPEVPGAAGLRMRKRLDARASERAAAAEPAGETVTPKAPHEMTAEEAAAAAAEGTHYFDSLYRTGTPQTAYPFLARSPRDMNELGNAGEAVAYHGVQFKNPLVVASRAEASAQLLGKNIYPTEKANVGERSDRSKAILLADDEIGRVAAKAGYDAIVTPGEIQVLDTSVLPPSEAVTGQEYDGIGRDKAIARQNATPGNQSFSPTVVSSEPLPSLAEQAKTDFESRQAQKPRIERPDVAMNYGRGSHDPVRVVFKDPFDKVVFQAFAMKQGRDGGIRKTAGLMKEVIRRLSKLFPNASETDLHQAVYAYRQNVVNQIESLPPRSEGQIRLEPPQSVFDFVAARLTQPRSEPTVPGASDVTPDAAPRTAEEVDPAGRLAGRGDTVRGGRTPLAPEPDAAESLFADHLANARELGWTGTDDEFRTLWDARRAQADELRAVTEDAQAEGGGRAFLQFIADNGGLGMDPEHAGEIRVLWESSTGIRSNTGTNLKTGGVRASKLFPTGGINGVSRVLINGRPKWSGDLSAPGGWTLESMREKAAESGLFGPMDTVNDFLDAVNRAIDETKRAPAKKTDLEHYLRGAGVERGKAWWVDAPAEPAPTQTGIDWSGLPDADIQQMYGDIKGLPKPTAEDELAIWDAVMSEVERRGLTGDTDFDPGALDPTPAIPTTVAARPLTPPEPEVIGPDASAFAARIQEKKQRIREIYSEIKARFSGPDTLTRKTDIDDYKRLLTEAASLSYDIATPMRPSDVKEGRNSTLGADVIATAHNDLLRNRAVYDAINEAAAGVYYNQDTAVDDIVAGKNPSLSRDAFREAFAATREALRRQFGDTVTLYRAQGQQKTKPTQNWASTRSYAEQFGDRVEERSIPVDDILAVNVGARGRYEELIVETRPKASSNTPAFRPIGKGIAILEIQPSPSAPKSTATAPDASVPTTSVSGDTRLYALDRVQFANPIAGENGAKLVSYQWHHYFAGNTGESGDIYRSDWNKAVQNEDTGKAIVHEFGVILPDGSYKTMSLESALKALGFLDDSAAAGDVKALASTLKTRAKKQLELQMLQAGEPTPDTAAKIQRAQDAIGRLDRTVEAMQGAAKIDQSGDPVVQQFSRTKPDARTNISLGILQGMPASKERPGDIGAMPVPDGWAATYVDALGRRWYGPARDSSDRAAVDAYQFALATRGPVADTHGNTIPVTDERWADHLDQRIAEGQQKADAITARLAELAEVPNQPITRRLVDTVTSATGTDYTLRHASAGYEDGQPKLATWTVKYFDRDGTSRGMSFSTEDEARAWLQKMSAHDADLKAASDAREAGQQAAVSAAETTLQAQGITIEPIKNGRFALRGNTYAHKTRIKEAGGRFNWDASKAWSVDRDQLLRLGDELRGLYGDTQSAGDGGADFAGDPRLAELRRRAEERPDDGGSPLASEGFVGDDTADLIYRGEKYGIPRPMLDEQVEDIARIVRARDKGQPLFILASEPGSGKTFVLGGAIRELQKRGAKRIVYVTLRQELITQIQKDLAAFGIDDVEFLTYPGMRTADIQPSDVLIFDEAHNIKNVDAGPGGAQQAAKAAGWIRESAYTILASATPFENPVQAQYLESTGVFDDIFQGFPDFALSFGASRFTNKQTGASRIYWKRTKTSDQDAAAARRYFQKLGIYTSRRIRLPEGQVDSRLVKVQAPDADAKRYEAITAAAAEFENEMPSFSRMWVTNFQKRLLEASKVQRGIEEAKAAAARGRYPIIFVETKAERVLDIPDILRREAEYQAAVAEVAAQNRQFGGGAGGDYPKRKEWGLPPEGIPLLLKSYMDATGESIITIPSAEDMVIEALGKDNVAVFTGSVTPKKAQMNLDAWRAGAKKILVATMAKGGTGLSLHDTTGTHQTTQININLPWTATNVVQVTQRSARYGLQGQAEIVWTFSDNIPFDKMLAARVGGRMADMGASVHGERLPKSENIETWDFEDLAFSEQAKAAQEVPEQAPVEEYGEVMPGDSGFGGIRFRVETGDRPFAGDTPPERTPDGDYVFYHGTGPDTVASIEKTGLHKDDIGKVGLGTRPGAVHTFAAMKKKDGASGRILRVVIDKNWLQNEALFTREGNHADLFLVQPVSRRIKSWTGIPRSAFKAIRDVSEEYREGRGTQAPPQADTLDTGEVQPRLPEAGAVREQHVQTPEFELPFSLSAPKRGKEKPKDQPSVLDIPNKQARATMPLSVSQARG